MMRPALTYTNMHNWIVIVLAQLADRCFTRTHYLDSEPTSLCSYTLVLCTYRRSSKYQFYSLWFDQTGAQTHDLPTLEASTLTIIPPKRLGQVSRNRIIRILLGDETIVISAFNAENFMKIELETTWHEFFPKTSWWIYFSAKRLLIYYCA